MAVQNCDSFVNNNPRFCAQCDAGFSLLADNTDPTAACSGCSTGHYCDGLSSNPCPPGSVQSEQNDWACDACPVGFIAATAGLTTCTPCSAAEYSAFAGSSRCLPIPRGGYGLAQLSLTAHRRKRRDSLTTTSSNITALAAFRLCEPGYYCVDGVRMPCTEGSYAAGAGSTACTPCAPGQWSGPAAVACMQITLGGIVSNTTTVTFSACSPGYSCVNGESTPCPAGTYQDTASALECKVCAPGTYSTLMGRTTPCEAVPDGYFVTFSGGCDVV